MKTILREPLLHFLLLGAALFLGYDCLNRERAETDPLTIVVDRDKLLTFAQYRSRVFDAARFNALLDSLPEEELQRLIQEYVREEALYREAKALQLDRNDYVARLRLIQQLDFIMRGFADAKVQLTEQEIQRYYEAHKSELLVKPKVTFTHVFFSSELYGAEKAQTLARAELRKLNQAQVHFSQASAYGGRFLYHVNYVQREPEEVASHFGTAMQQALFALKPSDLEWRGPFESPYGFHLVLLIRNEVGYVPPLEQVRARIEQEVSQASIEARFEESRRSIVQAYKVKVKKDEFLVMRRAQALGDEVVEDTDPSIALHGEESWMRWNAP